MLTAKQKVAILLHDGIGAQRGKTGVAFLRYSANEIVAVIDRARVGKSLVELTGIKRDIPIVASVADALAYQPDVLLIGIAPSGGQLPEDLRSEIANAVAAGVSIINGLHTLLAPEFTNLQPNQWIWDIRREPSGVGIATAKARSLDCKRILTVGTDMGVGKMSTSLEIYRAALRQGIKAEFLATGQAGVAIAGRGIALDAVRVDFAAGAVEKEILELGRDSDLVIVEGQGSLIHPGSTATLPLIRGTQPTGIILVHRAHARHIHKIPEISIPPLPEVVRLYETVASAGGAFGKIAVTGIALNTFGLNITEAKAAIETVRETTGLPCTDVVRFGGELLLAAAID